MEIEEIDGKKIIVATIRPGMAKPYYLRKDGMMDGTYIRIAGVTRKAEPYMIKELQLEGTGASFDTLQVVGEVSDDEITALCDRMYQHALDRCQTEEQRSEQKKVTVSQLVSWKALTTASWSRASSRDSVMSDNGEYIGHEKNSWMSIKKPGKQERLDAGIDAVSLLFMVRMEQVAHGQPLNNQYLINATNEDVHECGQMLQVFREVFIDSRLVTHKSDIVLSPSFGKWGSRIGRLDADVYIDGTLYDFKAKQDIGCIITAQPIRSGILKIHDEVRTFPNGQTELQRVSVKDLVKHHLELGIIMLFQWYRYGA